MHISVESCSIQFMDFVVTLRQFQPHQLFTALVNVTFTEINAAQQNTT